MNPSDIGHKLHHVGWAFSLLRAREHTVQNSEVADVADKPCITNVLDQNIDEISFVWISYTLHLLWSMLLAACMWHPLWHQHPYSSLRWYYELLEDLELNFNGTHVT